MKKYCIIVPVYKQELDICEDLSLNQLIKVCQDSNICLIHPEDLDISNYSKKYNFNFLSKSFSSEFFTSVESYSKLCLSYEFYDAFSEYEYILLYQLDCWIFKNDIEYWCNKDYDYIGAPIMSKYSMWPNLVLSKGSIPQVGNGGLSLRKISTMKMILYRNGKIFKSLIPEIQKMIIDGTIPEDVLICNVLNKYYFLSTPHWKAAARFSWDWNIDILYSTLKQLPMACHAIFKQIDFWKNIISELDNEEVIKFAKENWNEEAQEKSRKDMQELQNKIQKLFEILKQDGVI